MSSPSRFKRRGEIYFSWRLDIFDIYPREDELSDPAERLRHHLYRLEIILRRKASMTLVVCRCAVRPSGQKQRAHTRFPMHTHPMPLRWSDNHLANNLDQMTTKYHFRATRNRSICDFSDHRFQAFDQDELADLLVEDGIPDGTVQVVFQRAGLLVRHESLHGMAARFRTREQNWRLNFPRPRLDALFAKTGRGLRPEIHSWWQDTLSPLSRPWRLRHYVGSLTARRASRKVDTFFEFASDADMTVFLLAWL